MVLHRVTPAFFCALVALALPLAPRHASASEDGFQLAGAWHLTIHYRDEASGDPEAERWDDRLWLFEQRGSRLQWTEYPIVVFENREGRFESGQDERTARTLRFWQPNAAQVAQIEKGLVVDPRGARSKGMRGSPATGFRSVGGLRSESVSVIGYSESWTVEGLPGAPTFTQDVAMGSGRTEDVQGRTRYRGETVEDDGRVVRGSFARDGTRHGTFVLRRTPEPVVLGRPAGRDPGAS